MTLVGVGIAIGVVLAFTAGRLIAALLFGIAPTDAVTMAGAIAVMLPVSAFAGYLPARRASRIDPIVALHDE